MIKLGQEVPKRKSKKISVETKPSETKSDVKSTTTRQSQLNPAVKNMQQAILSFYSTALQLMTNKEAINYLGNDFKGVVEKIKNIGSEKNPTQADGLWGGRTTRALFYLVHALNQVLKVSANIKLNLVKTISDFPNLLKVLKFAEQNLNASPTSEIIQLADSLNQEINQGIEVLTQFNQKLDQRTQSYQDKKLRGTQSHYQGEIRQEDLMKDIGATSIFGWLNKGVVQRLQGQGYTFADNLQKLSFNILADSSAFQKYLTDQQVKFNGQPILNNPQALDYLLSVLHNNLIGG